MVDVLSRIKDEQEGEVSVKKLVISNGVFCALIIVTSQFLDSLRNEVSKNYELQAIVQDCLVGSTS